MIDKTWEHAGMTCAIRHGVFNAPCGYVIVPEGHLLYGSTYKKANKSLSVHGGVTFAGDLERMGYAVGFDMAHASDVIYVHTRHGMASPVAIRTDDECVKETNRLAEQLAALAGDA